MVLAVESVQIPSVHALPRTSSAQDIVLRSRIPGRERWQSAALLDCPDLARTVELIVGSEPGVRAVTANPLTGRVLVEFDPAGLARPVESSLRSALRFRVKPPVTTPAHATCRTSSAVPDAVGKLLAGELVCSLLKTVLFAAPSLPARAAVAAAMLLLMHRRA